MLAAFADEGGHAVELLTLFAAQEREDAAERERREAVQEPSEGVFRDFVVLTLASLQALGQDTGILALGDPPFPWDRDILSLIEAGVVFPDIIITISVAHFRSEAARLANWGWTQGSLLPAVFRNLHGLQSD